MGYTVWRRRHGDWQPVTTGMDNDAALSAARIHNVEAQAEGTGWIYSVTLDSSTPDVKRGAR